MASVDFSVVKDQPDVLTGIEKLQAEIDTSQDSSALFETDEFRIYCYKVLPCSKRAAHEWTTCPWAHPGEKARRRDPRIFNYLAIPCQETKEGKECPRGDDCPNCHSLFEYWLHPSRYRTQLCRNNDGCHCKRQICFFAHSIEELRVPDHSHLKIPDEIKQASASKDARTSAVEPARSPNAAPSSPTAGAASSDVSAAATAPLSHLKRDKRHSKGSVSRVTAAGLPPSPAVALGAPTGSTGILESSAGSATPVPSPAVCGVNTSSVLASLLSCPQAQGATGVLVDGNLAAQWVQQQQLGALQNSCYPSPATPAAALRRAASLDVASAAPGRLSFEVPVVTSGRLSLDTARPYGQNIATGSWANSSLFSSSMAADPEVPDPSNSPQSTRQAFLLQQQQHLFQSHQLEQQLDATAVEQQLQIMMAQQQQQQMKQKPAWLHSATTTAPGSRRGSYVDYAAAGGGSRRGSYVDYTAAGGGSRRGSYVDYTAAGGGSRRTSYIDYGVGSSRRGSYVDYGMNAASRRGSYVDYVSGTGSPPLSPATSSMLGSGSSGVPEECQSVSSHTSPYLGLPSAACPVPTLHRTISGPAACSNMATIPGTAIRYNSLDPAALAAAAAANQVPISAADIAAAAAANRAQMELLNDSSQSNTAAAMSAGLSAGYGVEPFTTAGQMYPEQPPVSENLNLQNVAELVDSVNRGELGERGSLVLTGVIGLLVQQLQQQQLAAVQEM